MHQLKFPDNKPPIRPDLTLTNSDFRAAEKEYCRRSLANYSHRAWKIVEPGAKLKWGWALDCVAEHLEAVSEGQIQKLLINIPPGCMKSLMAGVFWPSWEWGPGGKSWTRILGTAHKEALAVRDNVKMKRIIECEWYKALWDLKLLPDQSSKIKFENEQFGFREAMAFRSMTGSRGDRVILDDPLSVDDAKSETELQNAEDTFLEALPTRLNDPELSAVLVIMQRLHAKDTSGVILSKQLDYEHVMLPMEFEPQRSCTTILGSIDKRTEDGELLFEDRFPRLEVEKLKKTMGSYATAGQFQQRPAPRGGGKFRVDDFRIIQADEVPKNLQLVRAWDLAGSERKKSPYTAGALCGMDLSQNFYLLDMVRFRKTPGPMETYLHFVAEKDGRSIPGSIPQDPGQAGKSQAEAFVKKFAKKGFRYYYSTETGSKTTRAEPLEILNELGCFFVVQAPWNQDFFDEAKDFPAGDFKDQVDACSRGHEFLLNGSTYTLDNL